MIVVKDFFGCTEKDKVVTGIIIDEPQYEGQDFKVSWADEEGKVPSRGTSCSSISASRLHSFRRTFFVPRTGPRWTVPRQNERETGFASRRSP